jgi:hypothetical protein
MGRYGMTVDEEYERRNAEYMRQLMEDLAFEEEQEYRGLFGDDEIDDSE